VTGTLGNFISSSPNRRSLGNTSLACYPLGFGCYRVVEGNETHERALRDYLTGGGNLIDTSANYGDGRAELMVGKILKELSGEAIVVTKGGYIQGQNMSLVLERRFPEVVEYGDGLWHCIHPEFLETQIRRSEHRLRRNLIDVYLLHNPEYYLEEKARKGAVSEKDQKEFYRRIREAFRFLETKVDAGEVRWYGVSSNNFGEPASSPTMTSVERCWQEAQAVSPQHHFRVVQLPLNLYESGPALEGNNSGRTALEFCEANGIGVLVNRPLNAFTSGRLVRLADFLRPGQKAPGRDELRAMLNPLRQLESDLREQFDVPLLYATQGGMAEYLENMVPQISSPAHWEQVYFRHVIQPVERWATECQQLYGSHQEWRDWWAQFAQMVPTVLEGVARHIASSQQGASDELWARLRQSGYPENGATLSQRALHVLLGVEGVSSVLVGMRRPEYVADALAAASLPPLSSDTARAILSRFRLIADSQKVG
jgi:aryl-alcohol dehydrogenase-like predicted oxidoreductase